MSHRHTRRLATTAGVVGTMGVLAACLATTAVAQHDGQPGQVECTPHALPVPAGIGRDVTVVVRDADPSGRYVLGEIDGDSPEGFLWVDGELETRLTGPPGGSDANEYRAVNGSGVVVGVSRGGGIPWKYQDGTYTELQGGADNVWDINENGDILGTRYNASTVVWPAGDPDGAVELGDGIAADFSQEGVVVGPNSNFFTDYDGTAYYWPDWDSERQTLESPDGVSPIIRDVAGDWAVGHDTDDFELGVRWNLAEGTAEKLPYHPSAVNSAGDIGTDGALRRADGTELELPSPGGTDPAPGVAAVSEPGSSFAAAGSYSPSDDAGYRPVAWTC